MCAARPEGNRKRLSDFSLTGTDKLVASPEMAAKEPLLTDAGREYRVLVVKRKYMSHIEMMKPRWSARLHHFLHFHFLARRGVLSVFGYAPDYDTPAGYP